MLASLAVAAIPGSALADTPTVPGIWTQVDAGGGMPAGAGALIAYDGDSDQLVAAFLYRLENPGQ